MFTPPLGAANYPRAVSRNRRPYKTRDGMISALIYNDKQWSVFIDAVQPEWNNESLATLEQRAKQIDHVYALLAQTFLQRTTQEWLDLLRSLDIPAAPVRSLDKLFENEHLDAAGFFETVQTDQGPVRFPGIPTWFSRTQGRVHGGAPALGEHTQEVLEELGVDTEATREAHAGGRS
jgi:crotonobetainyl-CoA:carnitine CoA-transferase CaiB-like acyl-CoA transferase